MEREHTIEEMLFDGRRLEAEAFEKRMQHIAMKPIVIVQWVDRPYGITEPIPEDAWRAYGKATSVNGLCRVYRRAYGDTHPQQNAYCGHVRFAVDGKQVSPAQALRHLGDPYPENNAWFLAGEGKLPRW